VVRLGALVACLVAVAFEPSLSRVGAAVLVAALVGAAAYHRHLFLVVGWTARDAWRAVRSVLAALVVMAVVVVVARLAVDRWASLPQLLLCVPLGAGSYLGALFVVERDVARSQLQEVLRLLGRG
jgi:hypothetical protein